MGYNHVSCGVAAGLVSLPLLPTGDWPVQVGWVLAFGGAALLPDLDSVHATASRMWGPVTRSLSSLVSTIAGGHRQGTHDAVLAPVVFGGLAWLATLHPFGFGVLLALMIGLVLRGVALLGGGKVTATTNLVLSVAGVWWIGAHGAVGALALLPLVVAGGVLIHIAGDALTDEGVPVPVLWLLGVDRRLSLHVFTTSRGFEKLLVAPVLSASCLWLFCVRAGIHDVDSFLAWSVAVAGHLSPV